MAMIIDRYSDMSTAAVMLHLGYLEKSFAFLQPRSLDHQMIAGNPAFQNDGRTGADVVPDHVSQVVADSTGDAHHFVSLPHVAKFVFKAAVAGIEMGL